MGNEIFFAYQLNKHSLSTYYVLGIEKIIYVHVYF